MTEIKFIKPVLLCVLLLYTLSLSEISVTSDNTKGCSFSFTLDSLNIEVVERNGKKYSRVGFRSETGTSAETGEPLIPVEEFITGIPDREGFDISFVSERTKRIKLDHPLLLRPEDRYYDPDKGRDYSYSGRWISQPLFSVLRGLDCASFAVKPFIYNPETKTLYILEKGYGNISFETSNEHTGAPVSDGLINDMVINPEGSEHWLARPPEQGLGRIRSSFFERSGVIGKISIGNGTSDFNEGFTDENRMIAITPETINVSGNLNIDEISLYASVKDELDETVPPYDEIPDGVVRIPVIREDLNGNGVFDNNDRIIAYVSSISDYEFSPGPMEYRFDIHEYETDRSYWILRESGSAEMKGFTPPQSEWPVKDTVNKARYGKFYIKNTHLPEKCGSNCEEEYGGRTWAWRKLSNTSGALEMDLDIDDADFTSSLSMQFMFTSLRNGENTTLYFNGETIGDGTDTSWIDLEEWNRDNQRVKAEYFTTKSGCYCQELKSIDVRYTKRLDMSDKKSLSFFSSTNTGVKTYLVENLPDEKVYVLRIPASDSGISLIDTVTGNSSFTWSDTGAVGTRYFLCPESELDTDGFQIESEEPLSNNRHLIQNLRDRSNSSDYLIITPEIFLDQALRLAEHKETLPYFSSPSVVLISDVYREFSGGNMDPSAIRNFLVYVSEYWSSSESSERSIPKYTLLFGNGNYDYKGYTTKEKVRIPPFFIKETSSNDCTDDFFITLDPGEHILSSNSLPDAVIGRVTANTPDEASGFVQKIISLEGDDADYSEWRNSILLVADDDMQGNKHDGINHTGPSEDVKNTIKSVRPEINIKKVYEYEYEWNSVHYKPEATSALINSINSGTAFVNYFGHGSPDEWADERLLQLSDLSRLDNKGRLPVVASFSCSVGRFEVPSQSSLADRLAVINGRGASASFACTRDASASGNRYFALEFFRNYYNTDSSAVSPGDAFLKAKINRYSSGTPREYVLFGDPSVRYHVPEDTVDLEISANGSLISDTLKALQRIKISGKVRSNGEIRKDLGTKSEPANVTVTLFNPERDSVIRKDGGDSNVNYTMPGQAVLSGRSFVVNGEFEMEALVPAKIKYNTKGLRLSAYAWHNREASTGMLKDLIVSGTDSSVSDDTLGPVISVRPVYDDTTWDTEASVTDKITGNLPMKIEIRLYDENGIDLVSTGPDEGINYKIEGAVDNQNINHKVSNKDGDFREGTGVIQLTEEDISPGEYNLDITATDLIGNFSKLRVKLDIINKYDFSLNHVYNYPNPVPMNRQTRFFFYHSQMKFPSEVDVKIKIYTLSGRLIRVFDDAVNGQPWNLRDQRGARLSPDVYLYRVVAKAPGSYENNLYTSPIEKIVIHPPR